MIARRQPSTAKVYELRATEMMLTPAEGWAEGAVQHFCIPPVSSGAPIGAPPFSFRHLSATCNQLRGPVGKYGEARCMQVPETTVHEHRNHS